MTMVDDRGLSDSIAESGFFGTEGGDGADALDPAVVALVDELVEQAPSGQEGLLRVLLGLQAAFDRVSWRVQELVADRYRLSPAQVAGVVSFYPGLSSERRGRRKICIGTGCWLHGAEEGTVEQIPESSDAEEAPDADRVTVSRQRCVGLCGLAPVVRTDGRVSRGSSVAEPGEIKSTPRSGR
jgi:NADH:ubiquinone oxidoreductase subunit E